MSRRAKPSGEATVAVLAVVCLLLQQLLLSLHLGAHHQLPFRALEKGAEAVVPAHAHDHVQWEDDGHHHHRDEFAGSDADGEHHPHPEEDHQAQSVTRAPWPVPFDATPTPAGTAVVSLKRARPAQRIECRKEARPPAVSRAPAAPRAPPVVS